MKTIKKTTMKKTMMTKIMAALCVLVLALSAVACGSTKEYSVVGTWKADTGKISEITFNEDGTGSLKKSSEINVSMTYTIDGDTVKVITETLGIKTETDYTYTVTEDKLTLTESGQTVEFSKQ